MKNYKNVTELLKDNQYFSELLNGPCRPVSIEEDEKKDGGEKEFMPINPDWISKEMSERMTQVYHNLLPSEMPFNTLVRVVNNPDDMMDGVAVDHNSKRNRYIVVTIVPDMDFPYDFNFPLILGMSIISLCTWELSRAGIAASEKYARIVITPDLKPPILNNAVVEWVSLYIGRKEYTGPTNLVHMSTNSENLNLDTHLFKLRQMDHDLIRRLIEAVDADEKE